MSDHYDPNQRRVPAGHEGGGRWTRQDDVHSPIYRDVGASAWHGQHDELNEFNRSHATPLTLKDIERAGPAQTSIDEFDGYLQESTRRPTVKGRGLVGVFSAILPFLFRHSPREIEAPTDKPSNRIEREIEAKLAEFELLSRQNNNKFRAFIVFKLSEDVGTEMPIERVERVGRATVEQVKAVCKRLQESQQLLNKAVAVAAPMKGALTPQAYGSLVHKLIEERVKGLRDENFKAVDDKVVLGDGKYPDPNFGAEVWFNNGRQGEAGAGSVRVDLLELLKEFKGAVCVYDPKTEGAVLKRGRAIIIGKKVLVTFRDATHMFIIQLKPGDNFDD